MTTKLLCVVIVGTALASAVYPPLLVVPGYLVLAILVITPIQLMVAPKKSGQALGGADAAAK